MYQHPFIFTQPQSETIAKKNKKKESKLKRSTSLEQVTGNMIQSWGSGYQGGMNLAFQPGCTVQRKFG